MFAPQKSPQLKERERSLQRMAVLLSTSHQRPLRGFPGIVGQNLQAAGRNSPIFCVCQGGKACLHWKAPGKENYRATHAGPVTPVWLTRKEIFCQKLIRNQEKATVVCPWVGDRRWTGKQSPPLVLSRAAEAKQETGVDKRIFHANSILFPSRRKAPIEPNI